MWPLSTRYQHICVWRQLTRAIEDQPPDEDILLTLSALGWDERDTLILSLLSSELVPPLTTILVLAILDLICCVNNVGRPNLEKVFYHLLRERKNRRLKSRARREKVFLSKPFLIPVLLDLIIVNIVSSSLDGFRARNCFWRERRTGHRVFGI